MKIGNEYGPEYEGTYNVKALSWNEIREVIRRGGAATDKIQYLEELLVKAITGPIPFTKENVGSLPAGLMLRLIGEFERLNAIGREEANFLRS